MCDLETSRMGAPYIYDISHLRVKGPTAIMNLNQTRIQRIAESLRQSSNRPVCEPNHTPPSSVEVSNE